MVDSRQRRSVILTTAGTSLLNNCIDREKEASYQRVLVESAHKKAGMLSPEAQEILNTLSSRAWKGMSEAENGRLHRISAELNALSALYEGRLIGSGKQGDQHIIIASDTAPGRATADALDRFLSAQGFSTHCPVIEDLDTVDTRTYRNGVHNLLKFIEENLKGYREAGYRIIFNLSGGFKSLAGYLTGIGMIYADEIAFIFEGQGSQLVRITPPPVKLDEGLAERHFGSLALLAEEACLPTEALPDVPLTFVERDDLCMLSIWGRILWNRLDQDRLLSTVLHEYPGIVYGPHFVKDWESLDTAVRAAVQQAIVKAAALLLEKQGDVLALKQDRGLQYTNFKQRPEIGHFRVNQQWRISCSVEKGSLTLRHCGSHDHVEGKEGV